MTHTQHKRQHMFINSSYTCTGLPPLALPLSSTRIRSDDKDYKARASSGSDCSADEASQSVATNAKFGTLATNSSIRAAPSLVRPGSTHAEKKAREEGAVSGGRRRQGGSGSSSGRRRGVVGGRVWGGAAKGRGRAGVEGGGGGGLLYRIPEDILVKNIVVGQGLSQVC